MANDDQSGFADRLNGLSSAFDELCQQRHLVGQEEYGPFTFLGNDVTRMMMEELADTANYCRMQYIKLMLLQNALEEQLSTSGLTTEGQEEITLGIQAFRGTKDVGWQGGRK